MLVCLTANHRNAAFEVLEQLSTADDTLARGLLEGGTALNGAIVLATCNRFEAYLDVVDAPADHETVVAAAVAPVVEKATGVAPDVFSDTVTVLRGPAVSEHLFAVAAGLESVVVGEDEIAGQVRRALERARADGTTSSDLERLFQAAANTSKDVRNAAGVGGAGRSIVRLGLELASSRVAEWSATSVLLIGSGSYARTCIQALRERGVVDLSLYSPSGRGAELAARRGLTLVQHAGFDAALRRADVVIACTSHEQFVTAAMLERTESVPAKGRLVIDLGLPRNVEPAVACANVELLDLETIRLHAPLEQLDADKTARQLVADASERFEQRRRGDGALDALVTLRAHILQLVEQEVERARARGAGEETARALRHLGSVLLHTPSLRAREFGGRGEAQRYADAVRVLYALSDDDAAAGTGSA